MTLDEIRDHLKDRNLRAVAVGAGVHYNTLCRLANGSTDPSYSVVIKVIEYLKNSMDKTADD